MMMRSTLFLLLAASLLYSVSAQPTRNVKEFNFGFERISATTKFPDGWFPIGSGGYKVVADTAQMKSGTTSMLIEQTGTKLAGTGGGFMCSFLADRAGREIELRGFLKFENVTDGYVGLWMRIDGEDGPLQFDNMQSLKINGTSDWTQYSIKLPLPADGTSITIGALLTGKGKLWTDDLEVLIDGIDIRDAKPRPPAKAALDKEFDTGSRIAAIKLNRSTIENLSVLGKVWGFLKYHHPAIAAGDYNWDYELFRIMPKVLAATNRSERNRILSEWTASLGAFETAEEKKPNPAEVKLTADLAWINAATLGDKLTDQLSRLRHAKRAASSYYIGFVPGVGNPIFKNEAIYKEMNYPDAGFRLLGLFRYWNIIQYFYPNRHLIGEDWNGVLPEFIPRFAGSADELDYKKNTLALIARIHDTHANIWGNDATLSRFRGLNSPPVGLTFVEEQAVVTEYLDSGLGEKSGLKIGDIIITINGKSVSDIVKERLSITPASNYPTQLRDLAPVLLRTNERFVAVRYKRDNTISDARIEAYSLDGFNRSSRFNKNVPPFKLIGTDIAYLYPGSLKAGEIGKIIPEIAKSKGLVIDLRTYPTNFIVFSLGEFLADKPTDFVKFSRGSRDAPGSFTYAKPLSVGKQNPNSYKGKTVVLVNETSQSQAEYTAMAFKAAGAVVIGSTTAGADGNVSEFFLPGGIRTLISGIGVYYPNGQETQRVGIVPNVIVKPTIRGIRAGRDEVLEKAIEIINSGSDNPKP